MSFLRKINTIGKYKISFIAFLFVLLFSPPVIPKINVAIFAAIGAGVLLVVKYRSKIKEAFTLSGLRVFSSLLIIFLFYLAVVTVINFVFLGEHVQLLHYVKLWYRFFLIVPVLMICSVYICIRAKELNYGIKDLCLCFVFAAMIQFALVLVALLIPTVRFAFIKVMYANTKDMYLNIPWVLLRRGFGFSNSILDSFGWGVGLITALPLFLLSRKNKWILLTVPCILLISVLNVRTGLIIAGLGLFCSIPLIIKEFTVKEKGNLRSFLIFGASSVALTVAYYFLVYLINPITIKWIIGDMSSMVGLVIPEIAENIETDATRTTAQVLFSSRFWNLPMDITLIFGSGHTIFGASGYPNSDVGYINDLWMGGIVGCVLLYTPFYNFFKRSYRSVRDKNEKLIVIFFILSFLVFQIKANAIMFNSGLVVLFSVLSYLCYTKGYEDRHRRYRNTVSDQNDLISVIVPVYNVEEYLPRCVDSILTQSYKNTEVILVDDGSTDSCSKICDDYAQKDNRICVIHKENGGLSDARNAGIKAAKGEYLAFVDSDDFLHTDFLLTLYSACKNNNSQIAACGYYLYYSVKKEYAAPTGEEAVFTPDEAIEDIFTQKNLVHTVAWNKLYQKDVFKNTGILYPKGLIHEDVATTYALCAAADSVAYVPIPLYYYTQRKGSIIGTEFNPARLQLLDAVDAIKPFAESDPQKYGTVYQYYRFLNILTLLNWMADSKYDDATLYRDLLKKLNETVSFLKDGKYLGKKNRITLKLLNRGKRTFYFSRSVYNLFKSTRQLICG